MSDLGTALAAGISLVVGYKFVDRAPTEASKRKRTLALMIATAASMAFKYYSSNTQGMNSVTNSIHVADELMNKKTCEEAQKELKTIITAFDRDETARLIKIFNETRGISCDNYLPWDKRFVGATDYIDGIRAQDLQQSAMWGVDGAKRPFVAFKYTCDNGSGPKEGAAAFFQRYSNQGGPVARGSDFAPESCGFLGPLDPLYKNYQSLFAEFLKGEEVHVYTPKENILKLV